MPIPIPEETRAGLQPHTIHLCEITKEPNHAYILLEAKKYEAKQGPDGEYVRNWTTGLCWMNVQNQPNQAWLLANYILKEGMKMIGYGKIPSASSTNPRIQKIYKAHDEGGFGSNAYDRIRQECDSYIGQRAEVNQEIQGYKAELEAAKKEIEALKLPTTKAKKEAKNDANQD